VPTYEYHCDGCGRDFEVKQRITEDPLKTCDVCGGPVHRLLSPAPFILKGEGWYVTDYPSASRKKAMESDKGGGDKTAAPAEKSGTEKSASSGDGASTSSSAPASPSSSSSTKSD
jgi:putative FmdB family regulatory protein